MAVTLRYFAEFGKHAFQHNGVNLWRNLCTSLLYFVVRVRCRVKNVHVRYLISWWDFCMLYVPEWECIRNKRPPARFLADFCSSWILLVDVVVGLEDIGSNQSCWRSQCLQSGWPWLLSFDWDLLEACKQLRHLRTSLHREWDGKTKARLVSSSHLLCSVHGTMCHNHCWRRSSALCRRSHLTQSVSKVSSCPSFLSQTLHSMLSCIMYTLFTISFIYAGFCTRIRVVRPQQL